VRTEVLEIDERFGKNYAGQYTFQEISWAKRSRIIQKHTKYHPISGQVVNSDYIAIQAETIVASLKEQPAHKPVTLERLLSEDDGLPIGLGELFSQTMNRLCGVTLEESAFLSEPSADKDQTQQSQTSASAKSSAGLQTNSRNSPQKPSSGSSLSSTS
jgi:hypothetical protein